MKEIARISPAPTSAVDGARAVIEELQFALHSNDLGIQDRADQAARLYLAALKAQAAPATLDVPMVDTAIEKMREDPFIDDASLLGTTQQDLRMEHYAKVVIASLAPATLKKDEYIRGYVDGYKEGTLIDIDIASTSIAEMVADWYGNAPLPNARITAEVIAQRLARFAANPQAPASLSKRYCQCANSKTNPCSVCGKPKFIDPEWLKRKIEEDRDEGEIGAGFELFPLPEAPAAPVGVSIKPMRLSDGQCDYFVSFEHGAREVTPHVFRDRFKAEYHVALYRWLFGQGDEPDIMEFNKDEWPARTYTEEEKQAFAALVATPPAQEAAPESNLRSEILSRIAVFRDMEPEEDETWESWYFAAFDMLRGEISSWSITLPAPTSAVDMEVLKALRKAEQFIANGIELGFIRMPDANTPDSAHDTLPLIRAALSQAQAVPAREIVVWAVGRWNAEVKDRPLVNVHRRSLDDSWRQIIRHFGGNAKELCGPAHDELVALAGNPSGGEKSS
ncbi:hypothetical protein [Mesorhizobium sp. M0578]|uniref:hypothetical protein n=1 Tax=unclassified Mesorhizobium TaxID=325217 RepID=UPI0033350D7F